MSLPRMRHPRPWQPRLPAQPPSRMRNESRPLLPGPAAQPAPWAAAAGPRGCSRPCVTSRARGRPGPVCGCAESRAGGAAHRTESRAASGAAAGQRSARDQPIRGHMLLLTNLQLSPGCPPFEAGLLHLPPQPVLDVLQAPGPHSLAAEEIWARKAPAAGLEQNPTPLTVAAKQKARPPQPAHPSLDAAARSAARCHSSPIHAHRCPSLREAPTCSCATSRCSVPSCSWMRM